MRKILFPPRRALALAGAAVLFAGSANVNAQAENFDAAAPGSLPPGWVSGSTGGGKPQWAVAADPTAPGKPNVLLQSGSGKFPWAVKADTRLRDGYVQARFKPISGREDAAGGLIWRFIDGDTYYVARANANEDNVSLYYTERGVRNTIKYVDAPVLRGAWHTLRVEFKGTRIRVMLNGKAYIEVDDAHLKAPGAVGLWTKADSVTAFDDFSYGTGP